MRPFLPAFLLLFLGLVACSASYEKHYTYEPLETPGGRLCSLQCSDARNYCAQNCDMDQRRCTYQVQSQALKDYEQYTRDQFMSHQPIELHTRDFERLTPCDDDKKSCLSDCEESYHSCYQSCGGTVDIKSSCQFLCF